MQVKWEDFFDFDGDSRIEFWISRQKRRAGGKQRGGHLDVTVVQKAVHQAALAAGLDKPVSRTPSGIPSPPSWF
jgi:hypothetical protein